MNYYYKLNSHEWNEDVGNIDLPLCKKFNDYQISKLVSFGFKDDRLGYPDYEKKYFIRRSHQTTTGRHRNRYVDKYDLTEVFMDEDEWIYVRNKNGTLGGDYYYKCDQFEGLLKLFNDIGINEVKPSVWNRIKSFSKFKNNN